MDTIVRPYRSRPRKAFICRCSCGNVVERIVGKVLDGSITSCGCKPKPKPERTIRQRLYGVWAAMKARCSNPKKDGYERYGGRGITYDPSWESFDQFLLDMQDTYQPGLELDREDNDQGYSKENCRWVFHRVNMWNQNPKGGMSKYMGVTLDKRTDKWIASIRTETKVIKIGTYSDEQEAAIACDTKCQELRGKHGRLNQDLFPDDFGKVIVMPVFATTLRKAA